MRLQATGRPGFMIDSTPGKIVLRARKREAEVTVTFAREPARLLTLEGEVNVRVGDALVTGADGDRWRVSSEHFDAKYYATATPGRYWSRPYEARALRLTEPCEVLLCDGVSTLRGQAGDWLLDYGDGSLGIVSANLFDLRYELI